MLKYQFKGKTVLITAASKGIGFEIAKQLVLCGANVSICSRNSSNLKKAKKEILKLKNDARLLTIKHDLTNTKNIKKVLLITEKYFKSNIDILINNSGGPSPKPIMQTKSKDWENALNVNLKSAIYFSMLASQNMKKKKWGRIINLTSTTAKEPAKNMCLSNITRAALASFGKTFSMEVAEFGITVNTILTGGVLTDRLKSLIQPKAGGSIKNLQKEIKKISQNIPVQRIASPNEFVQIILFLCSENSSYVNGTAIPIDGGSSKSLF